MDQLWTLVLILACTIFVLPQQPDWGYQPYEYNPDSSNQYSYDADDATNDDDQARHAQEEHHENQHRLHENSQESYYDVKEKEQQRAENDQESDENTKEDDRSAAGNRKSGLYIKVNPQISEKDAKSFLKRRIMILR